MKKHLQFLISEVINVVGDHGEDPRGIVDVMMQQPVNIPDNRPTNPKGSDGRYLTCYGCGSYRHLLSNCPYAYEKDRGVGKAENVKAVSDENVVLFTGYDKEEVGQLGEEGMGCAVLDTACTSTVCGTRWMDCFLQTLSSTDMQDVKHEAPYRVFKFGGGEKLKSQMNCTIPCRLGNRNVLIKTDVVESDIPLLLSLKALKTARVKLVMFTVT